MHVCGRGLGADFGGEVVGLNLPYRDAADLRISEFHIRHVRLLRHQRLQAVAAFVQILDQRGLAIANNRLEHLVVPEFLRTLVFARPRGDDQFADCTFSPSLDMSR